MKAGGIGTLVRNRSRFKPTSMPRHPGGGTPGKPTGSGSWKMIPKGSGGDLKLQKTYVRKPRSTDPKVPTHQGTVYKGGPLGSPAGASGAHPGGGIPLLVGPKFKEALATRKAERRASSNAYLAGRRDIRAQFKSGAIDIKKKHELDQANHQQRQASAKALTSKMKVAHTARAKRQAGFVAPEFVGRPFQ